MTQEYTPAQARNLAEMFPKDTMERDCLRSLATQVEELQAQLEAVGAGGVQRLVAPVGNFGVPVDRIALLLKNSMKPEEINGEPRVQHSRVAEIISWMARYTEGKANGKWLVGHACELAYYIASNGVNQHIDMSAATDKAFTNGVNISDNDRAMLNRINPDKFPPKAAPVAQLSEPPDGWKYVLVNSKFNGFIEALERADDKGYLPWAMQNEWDAFDWRLPAATTTTKDAS